jgi:hypothetical protein
MFLLTCYYEPYMQGQMRSISHSSWIYISLCNQCLSMLKLCVWFPPLAMHTCTTLCDSLPLIFGRNIYLLQFNVIVFLDIHFSTFAEILLSRNTFQIHFIDKHSHDVVSSICSCCNALTLANFIVQLYVPAAIHWQTITLSCNKYMFLPQFNGKLSHKVVQVCIAKGGNQTHNFSIDRHWLQRLMSIKISCS